MQSLARNTGNFAEALLITSVFAGWFIYCSLLTVAAGFPVAAFTNRDALELVGFECAAFFVAAVVLVLRGWRLHDFQFSITWSLSLFGLLLYIAAFGCHVVLWVCLGKQIGGSELVEELVSTSTLTLPVLLLMSIVNGAFEEFFLTRYLVATFAKHGMAFAIGVSGAVRLLYHLYQGPWGAIAVLLFGLVVTLFYWRYRELWPVMVAHMLADFMAFA